MSEGQRTGGGVDRLGDRFGSMEVARRRRMQGEVKWLKHYSSAQTILVVGDGDFSFSLALATAFGSGENIVATSLDSYEDLTGKYTKSESNVLELKRMRAIVLHRVDVKTMKTHPYLNMIRFNRIVFNFPHAGFIGKEYNEANMIRLHKDLVKGFLGNARHLVQLYGEIHISHKTGYPYDAWDLEQLALESSLAMLAKVSFKKEDYPGYNQKRGDGAKCNRSFPLGDCCTYKFRVQLKQAMDIDQMDSFQIAAYLFSIIKVVCPPEEWSSLLRPVRQWSQIVTWLCEPRRAIFEATGNLLNLLIAPNLGVLLVVELDVLW